MSESERQSGASLFVRSLKEYGVTHVFGNPGTTELPLVDAIEKSTLDYILTLHEDVAVGAAAGFASTRRYHAEQQSNVTPLTVANDWLRSFVFAWNQRI